MTIARARVRLVPLGNKIKFQLGGRVCCSQNNQELPNSATFDKDDLVWRAVFGSLAEVERFLNRNRVTSKIVSLYALGYSECDKLF